MSLTHPWRSAEEAIQWKLPCLAEKASKMAGSLEKWMVVQLLLSQRTVSMHLLGEWLNCLLMAESSFCDGAGTLCIL